MKVENELSLVYIFKKTKNYAEVHTALTLGIATITFSAIAFVIQLCNYAYQIGYYGYFGVEKLNILIDDKASTLVQIFYLISLSGIVLLLNLLSYISYRRGKYLKFFFTLVGFPYVVLMVMVLIVDGLDFFTQTALPMLVMVLLIGLLASLLFLGYVIDASKSVKIERLELKLQKLNKASRKNIFKINKLEQQKARLSDIKPDDRNPENAKKRGKLSESIKAGLLISTLGIIIILFTTLGWWIALQNKNISIVENSFGQNLSVGNIEVNKFAIIYENNSTVILAPCYEKADELYIDRSYQITIDKKELLVMKREYRKITMVEFIN